MAYTFPDAILRKHTAVLGMTGAGKSSVARLMVEQVVRAGSRVCILDPVKSDWWGITSTADGLRPGFPFRILGGPHGHVALHASAGAAVGEMVGSGKLPLSIVDMADFGPGGLQEFFNTFAPALMKSVRGVVYLVIEEAHEFAPKERAGYGGENLTLHWAKKLATGGRSLGLRLVVCTQRTQSLHNALLGSCETMVALRLMAPADQKPVVDFLKANISDETAKEVKDSLSSLPDGTGWICSGVAKIFEKVAFPRITTYDNSATPEDDRDTVRVRTAPVDTSELRAIIGEAVAKVEANDPKKLRERIAHLEAKLKATPAAASGPTTEDVDEQVSKSYALGYDDGVSDAKAKAEDREQHLVRCIRAASGYLLGAIKSSDGDVPAVDMFDAPTPATIDQQPSATIARQLPAPKATAPKQMNGSGDGESMSKAERAFLTVMAQRRKPLTRRKVAIFSGYSVNSRHVDHTLQSLRRRGWIEGTNDALKISGDGAHALGRYEKLPVGAELRDQWLRELDKAGRAFFATLCDAYPRSMTRAELAEKNNYSTSSRHVDHTLQRLRSLELAVGKNDAIKASGALFE